MKKKGILFGILGLSLALCMTACSNNKEVVETPSIYDVTLAKPMVVSSNGTSFTWAPVVNAKGYVAKLDNGEPFGIGNTLIETVDGVYCYYVQSTDSLTVGKHTISFAAYKDDETFSEWTDSFDFYVEDKTTVVSRPTLSSNLSVNSDTYFDKVLYDFGNGITKEFDLELTSNFYPTLEQLNLKDKLEDGKTYVVSVKVAKDGVFSEVSKPIAYRYNKGYYVANEKPLVDENTFVFEEKLYSPTITAKVDGIEYIIDFDMLSPYDLTQLDVVDILEILIETNQLDAKDYLVESKEVKVSIKVNFDERHYLESEYSEEINYKLETDLESLFNYMLQYIDVTSVANENLIKIKSITEIDELYLNLLSFSAYEIKENGTSYTGVDVLTSNAKNVLGVVNYSDEAESVEIRINFICGEFTRTKTIKHLISSKTQYKVSNLLARNGSTLTWDSLANEFEVEVKSGDVVKKYVSNSHAFDINNIELSGDLEITVRAVVDNKTIEESKSDTVKFKRYYAPTSLSINNQKNTINTYNDDLYIVVYYEGGSTSNSQDSNILSLIGARKVEAYFLGDGVLSLNSKISTFEFEKISNFNYSITDARYLEIDGLDISDYIDYSYSKYFADSKFDLVEYYNKENESAVYLYGFVNDTLSIERKNKVINGSIHFETSPRVIVENDYQKATNTLKFKSEVANYTGSYKISVKKYDEISQKYMEVKNEVVNNNYYYLSSLEEGKYLIAINTIGNGYVVNGPVKEITYIVNEEKVIDNVELVAESQYSYAYVKTRINFSDSINNLEKEIRLKNKNSYGYERNTVSGTYYELSSSNLEEVYIETTNNVRDVFYKYLPSDIRILSSKKIDTSGINLYSYAYDVAGFEVKGIDLISYPNLAARYVKNGKTYFQTSAGDVVITPATETEQEVKLTFVSIPVTNFNNAIDSEKYICVGTNNVSNIIVCDTENLYEYLTDISYFKNDNYVWQYKKKQTESVQEDSWLLLDNNVQIADVSLLRVIEVKNEYTLACDDCDAIVNLSSNNIATVTYETYPSTETTNFIIDDIILYGTYRWGYADKTNNIIYLRNNFNNKLFKIVDKTLVPYELTTTEETVTYTVSEDYIEYYIENMVLEGANRDEITEEMNKFRDLEFKVTGNYVQRYYNNKLMETILVDEFDLESNQMLGDCISFEIRYEYKNVYNYYDYHTYKIILSVTDSIYYVGNTSL